MKITSDMQDKMLSFEDLQLIDDQLIDLVNEEGLTNEDLHNLRPQFIDKFTHSFLEWDLYEDYVSCKVWHLNIILPFCDNKNCFLSKEFIDMKINIDTIKEVEAVATMKISQILSCPILLVPSRDIECAYFIFDYSGREGIQRGTLLIESVKEIKHEHRK